MPYSYPIGANESPCYLVPIRASLVPFVAGSLRQLEAREAWETETDFENAYNAIAEFEASMLNSCIADLVTELRAARGLQPEFVSVDPLLQTTDMYYNLGQLVIGLQEARGVLSSGWFGVNPELATIADVVRAMQGTSSTEGKDILGRVKNLFDTGADAGEIAGEAASFLASEEQTIVEGGLLTALIAITALNSALLAAMTTNVTAHTIQLTALIQALRGTTVPEDNILQALRGTVDSSETRNITDLLQ